MTNTNLFMRLTNVSSNSPILRKKYPRSRVRKIGHGNIETENKDLPIKRKPPCGKISLVYYIRILENCQTRYTGLEISGMIKSVAKKAAQGLRRRKERK